MDIFQLQKLCHIYNILQHIISHNKIHIQDIYKYSGNVNLGFGSNDNMNVSQYNAIHGDDNDDNNNDIIMNGQ